MIDALNSIQRRGISHPLDFEKAVQVFEILYERGEKPESEYVRQYLHENLNMPNEKATMVAHICEAVIALLDFQTGTKKRPLRGNAFLSIDLSGRSLKST